MGQRNRWATAGATSFGISNQKALHTDLCCESERDAIVWSDANDPAADAALAVAIEFFDFPECPRCGSRDVASGKLWRWCIACGHRLGIGDYALEGAELAMSGTTDDEFESLPMARDYELDFESWSIRDGDSDKSCRHCGRWLATEKESLSKTDSPSQTKIDYDKQTAIGLPSDGGSN